MESANRSTVPPRQSRPWTPWRIAGASVWVLATAVAAGWFLLVSIIDASSLFGDPPDEGRLIDSARNMLLAGTVAAAGPLGVWILNRARGWLIASACLLGAATIASLLIRY